MEIIDFKSSSEYFYDEKDGLKNNTVREIDVKDKRFHELLKCWKEKSYPFIRINHAECCTEADKATEVRPNTLYSFLRNIQHIAVYKNLIIITWEHIVEVKENGNQSRI